MQCSERKIICYFCKNSGHNKQNCPKYKRWLENKGYTKKDTRTQNSSNESEETSQQRFHDRKITSDKANALVGTDDSNDEEKSEFLFSIGKVNPDKWNLDSAATSHLCKDKSFFDCLDESFQVSVKLPNGENIEVMGIGSGTFSFLDGNGNTKTARVENVIYAPSAIGNFLSVSRLAKLNYCVEFGRSTAEIKYKGVRIGVADMKGGMYCLRQPYK